MSIQIIWSTTNGGSALDEPVSHGDNVSGNELDAQTLFLRHTGENPLTSCAIYIRAYSSTYSGDATASADLSEIIAWGDAASEEDFGGFQVNFNAVDDFPSESWSTYANKTTVDTLGDTFRSGTGHGSSYAERITIPKETYDAGGVDGEIPAGLSPDVSMQFRFVIPESEDTSGTRLIEQVLVFNYTS